ncbi:MAG TPA: hypothetical protein VLV76_17195 [Candidatus Acidoferrum sp.]|nr:hypothetical protein [Candidatus Acidoferrum sp.]
MLHTLIESANPPAAVESSGLVAQQPSDSSREPATAPTPTREEDQRPSPVCAARWAY